MRRLVEEVKEKKPVEWIIDGLAVLLAAGAILNILPAVWDFLQKFLGR